MDTENVDTEKGLDFEVLLVKDNPANQALYDVVGTSYSNALIPDSSCKVAKASYLTVQKVKELLRFGKDVKVPKFTDFPEIVIGDLIVKESSTSDFGIKKEILLHEISSRMHQSIIGVSVIDAMDFMTAYMKLLNYGIFITDDNRDDKYFEIFEMVQNVDDPGELSEDATFEEEREYLEKKKQYDEAQDKLKTLQSYLNAYDNLSKIKYVTDVLNTSKKQILESETDDELDTAIQQYKDKLKLFDSVPNV